ncbi:MAG: hypothetical protein F2681_03735 [Actinobacteria bacterium]|uniref:Unannotated protein n=1 Tax=freshwater metagenome TaxID=449393 RepID=A0A6J7CAF2_9ZZZZ|nr:hypothetical protein [Actinomycetota bacterium]MSW76786.1 hypothetical protein [Actinomycetota bacterium]MSX56659.1 hypothetical protein [Actinomycetota bacterium]MSZ82233.1 hypothetical protein [Actinomycetota bacterium]MTB17072.1 hypothetical protein [Actinomycetota bacterium]
MTDQDQAARLAAIRAKRGQAPVATTSNAAPRSATAATGQPTTIWAAPVAQQAQIPAPPIAPAQSAAPAAAARPVAARPAATARTNATRGKKGHPHIAAGARIAVTGLAASGIFGLTTVIAAANQPKVPTAYVDPSLVAPTTLYADPALTTVATTVPGSVDTVVPGGTVVLTIPAVGQAPAAPAATAPPAVAGAPVTAAPATAPKAGQPAAAPVTTTKPVAGTPVTAAPVTAPPVTAAPTPPPTAAPVTTAPPAPATTTKCSPWSHQQGKC